MGFGFPVPACGAVPCHEAEGKTSGKLVAKPAGNRAGKPAACSRRAAEITSPLKPKCFCEQLAALQAAHSTDGGQQLHSYCGQRSRRRRTRCAGVLSAEKIVAEVAAMSAEPVAGRCPSTGPGDLSHGLAFEGHLVRNMDDAVQDVVGQRGLVLPGVPDRHRQLAGDER